MRVSQSMKTDVITIHVDSTVADAANIFSTNHIGVLPVIDDAGRLVGILELRDLLHLIMPSFVDLIKDIDYVGNFGAMEERKPAHEELNKNISKVMEPPISVQDDSGLVRAFAFIHKRQLLDLPVVDREGKLVGLASRVDIGRTLLSTWYQDEASDQSA